MRKKHLFKYAACCEPVHFTLRRLILSLFDRRHYRLNRLASLVCCQRWPRRLASVWSTSSASARRPCGRSDADRRSGTQSHSPANPSAYRRGRAVVTGPRRTGGLKFYTYIGPSNHAFTLIASWAAMALVDLLLPWDARPLFI